MCFFFLFFSRTLGLGDLIDWAVESNDDEV